MSLDALAADRFFELTRRDSLDRVLAGLAAAQAHPELRPIKVNAVALRGFTEDEVLRFARFAREEPYEVRFIEFMPLDADQEWDMSKVLPSAEIKAIIETEYELVPLGRERHGTARRYAFADGKGEIGFISPVTEPFCGDCNRIRITAEGMLRTCLFSMNETDLRAPLRAGRDRRRARADRARRRLAQGAQAPRRRAGLHPAGALDVADRRVALLEVGEAWERVAAATAALPTERVPLAAAQGRIAAEDVRSRRRPAGLRPLRDGRLRGARRRHRPARAAAARRRGGGGRGRRRARSRRAPRSASPRAPRCPTAPTRSCASRTPPWRTAT